MFNNSIQIYSLSRKPEYHCIFQGVSRCADFVSPYVCNEHAKLFGLIYKRVKYRTALNETWIATVTYIYTNNDWNLPLFVNANKEILLDEIISFVTEVESEYPGINVALFREIIKRHVGYSDYVSNCAVGSWLDNDGTKVITIQQNNELGVWSSLPNLHKYLLAYTKPSIEQRGEDIIFTRVPLLALQFNSHSMRNSYKFTLIAPAITLKYETDPLNVATPLVLQAINQIDEPERVMTARKVIDRETCFPPRTI